MKKRGVQIVLGGGGYLRSYLAICGIFRLAFLVFFGVLVFQSQVMAVEQNTSTSVTSEGYSLSLAAPKVLKFNLDPTPAGAVEYQVTDVSAATTNPTGLTLTMKSGVNVGVADNSLVHENSAVDAKILPLSNSVNVESADFSGFPVNRWGVAEGDLGAYDSLLFKPMPTNAEILLSTAKRNVSGEVETAKLTFLVKANNDLAAGNYRGEIVFSVVANSLAPTFSGITTMQQMTSAICAAETTPAAVATESVRYHTTDNSLVPEAVLTDIRDNNTYVVRKLADGNCWMSQNLRLGGSSPITLKPTDTDLSSNFVLTESSNSFGATADAAGINIVRMNSDYANYWVDDDYTTNSQVPNIKSTGTPVSQTQYIGNYYNWYTATAGSGTYAISTNGQNATASICPKNWRLPRGGSINISLGNGEYQTLCDIYGLTDQNSIKPRQTPISAVMSGFWNINAATLQGEGGFWLSSTAASDIRIYGVDFYLKRVTPQVVGQKRAGGSVRCVAR